MIKLGFEPPPPEPTSFAPCPANGMGSLGLRPGPHGDGGSFTAALGLLIVEEVARALASDALGPAPSCSTIANGFLAGPCLSYVGITLAHCLRPRQASSV